MLFTEFTEATTVGFIDTERNTTHQRLVALPENLSYYPRLYNT